MTYAFERRTDIQGIRGLAVVLVVLYHAGLPTTGGFVGVDVFFVISGFVIGGGILRSLSSGRFSAADFYTRRVRRLLPALSLMLSTVVLGSAFLGPEKALAATWKTALSATFLNANHFLFQAAGYFDSPAEFNPLLHTWSLSVEEQFYLFFPLVIVGIWRASIRRNTSPLTVLANGIAVISVASFVLNIGLMEFPGFMGIDTRALAFYGCFTRVWEFGVGALLAVYLPKLREIRANLDGLGFAGFAAILAAAVLFTKETVFPGYAALLPVLGTAMLVVSGAISSGRSNIRRVFETRWLVRIGDLSYAWYLWHWPAIVFARATWPNEPKAVALALTVSLVAAWLTEKWVEMPIRRRPTEQQRPIAIVALACVFMPVVAVFGQIAVVEALNIPAFQALRQAKMEYSETGCDDATSLKETDPKCVWGTGPTSVVVVGDSNAQQHLPAFHDVAGSDYTIKATTMLGCPFVDLKHFRDGLEHKRCRRWVQETLSEILTLKPDVVVIGIATDAYATASRFEIEDARVSEQKKDYLVEGLSRLTQTLSAAGIRVLLLDPIPKFQTTSDHGQQVVLGDSCSAAALLWWPNRCAPQRSLSDPHWLNPEIGVQIHEVAVRDAAQHIDFSEVLCPDGQCRVFDGQEWLYRDDAHLSPQGSRLTTELLRSRLGQTSP
jgi:peptidoglycan/LPS O-acetylase OafA/YrhL